MEHTGTLFLGRTRPAVSKADDGAFQLTLLLIDNLGAHKKEAYRVRFEGPAAQAFHTAHAAALEPGTPVWVRLSHLRVYPGTGHPPTPELRARVESIEIRPKRTPTVREQLSEQEQHAQACG